MEKSKLASPSHSPHSATCCLSPALCQSIFYQSRLWIRVAPLLTHHPLLCGFCGGSQSKTGTARTKARLNYWKCGDFSLSVLSLRDLDARGDNLSFLLTFMLFGLPMIFFPNKRTKITFPAVYFCTLNPPGFGWCYSTALTWLLCRKPAAGQNCLLLNMFHWIILSLFDPY